MMIPVCFPRIIIWGYSYLTPLGSFWNGFSLNLTYSGFRERISSQSQFREFLVTPCIHQ